MRLLRFADLCGDNGEPPIVRTRTTLNKWIDTRGFPPGRLLGRYRVWTEAEIEKWVLAQSTEVKQTPRGCTTPEGQIEARAKRLAKQAAEHASNGEAA